MTDGHTDALAGAYALGACPPDEAQSVAEHARTCPTCAAEVAELARVAEWIGTAGEHRPAAGLRSRVLAAARAARPPTTEASRLGEVYGAQVAELDGLLAVLTEPQWLLPSGPHRSVRDLVVHLRGNDERVAAVSGVDPATGSGADPRRGWRRQADAIIEALDSPVLDEPVQLAGHAGVRRPVREAMVQRGFETWIHAEDVRVVLGLPPRVPSARQLADIVDFAAGLLPGAMAAAGRAHPGKAVHLVLTGPGAGTRQIALAPASAPAAVAAGITLPAERFCRLLAGRLTSAGAEIDGDRGVAVDFLTVAATMGCD
ncbi:maleylpyruvate isomerase family mycothiol-dependent enzyme [Asanoa sp. NPDC050611]|uniref:maleylpyruvate isomerase family mycothiol-dependent enzyme n=1 Tax=Asanoa sp. NPDC050611 TaxID=3157098 RepID=UPI0033D2731F